MKKRVIFLIFCLRRHKKGNDPMAKTIKKQNNVYKHLSPEERDLLSGYLAEGKNQSDIAKILGRDPSTISRELSRNSLYKLIGKYHPITAQNTASKRLSSSRQKDRLKNPEIRELVSKLIRNDWTPEQVAGHINSEFPHLHTNHESIYLYIYNEAKDLIPYLVRSQDKRKKRLQKQGKRASKIPNRIMISERPEIINKKKRYSDWEADTVVSRKSKACLVVLRERKSQKVKIRKIESRTAENTSRAIISMLKYVPGNFRKSITFDNGLENAHHEIISRKLNLKTYFCNPYHSWEKGGVENVIGLIRRYLPKKTDFSLISDSFIRYIENQLNNRPRKSLGFKSPYQVFLNCTL